MYRCIDVYMYICIDVYTYICIYEYIWIYMYICIYAYMHICIFVYMYICIYAYIYIFDRERERGDCSWIFLFLLWLIILVCLLIVHKLVHWFIYLFLFIGSSIVIYIIYPTLEDQAKVFSETSLHAENSGGPSQQIRAARDRQHMANGHGQHRSTVGPQR